VSEQDFKGSPRKRRIDCLLYLPALFAEVVKVDVIRIPHTVEVVTEVRSSFQDEPISAVRGQYLQEKQVEHFNYLSVRAFVHKVNGTDYCLWYQ
jgi:hypothetical protein